MKNDATGKTIIEETQIETSNTTDKNTKIPIKLKNQNQNKYTTNNNLKQKKWAEWSEATNSAY